MSKRAGVVVLCLLATVLGLFAYGGYKRQVRDQAAAAEKNSKSVTAATAAGAEITKEILSEEASTQVHRGKSDSTVPELQPPSDPATPHERQIRPNTPTTAAVSLQTPAEPSPEDKRMLAAYQQELQAMTAPTAIARSEGLRFSSPVEPQAGGGSPETLARLAALMGSSPATRAPRGASGDPPEYTDQNAQSPKEAFLERARGTAASDYLKSTRTVPLSRYEIKAGWEIPAVMEQGLNSDLPGELKALVTSNVFDTATGRYLLIPQGSRLVGIYDSHIGYGQERVQVVWNGIIFPDASSIDLNGMTGQDAQGQSGFRHTVDHHYKRLIGFAVLTSLFSAGFELSQKRNQSVLAYPSSGQVAAGAVGREVTQLGAEITRRNVNVQPTVKIPIGYRFNVRVNRDILFEGPYQPLGPVQ